MEFYQKLGLEPSTLKQLISEMEYSLGIYDSKTIEFLNFEETDQFIQMNIEKLKFKNLEMRKRYMKRAISFETKAEE